MYLCALIPCSYSHIRAQYSHKSQAMSPDNGKVVETSIIRDFGVCEGIKKTSLHFDRIAVNVTGRGATTFNGYIDVDEDLDHISHMEVRVDKCNSYTDTGSCEFHSSYKFPDPCEKIMTLKDGPWAAIFNTKPSLSCPVKKGSYKLYQSAVKANHLTALSNVFWKFSMKLFVGKRIVACVKGGIEKAVFRNKSKPKHH